MNLQVKLKDEHNIDAQNLDEGSHKIKCPQCQPPHDSHDTPLSVSINDDGAVWLCHHCDWTGGTGSNNYQNNYAKKNERN